MLVVIFLRQLSILHDSKKLTEAETHVTEETCELLVSLDEKQKELIEYQTNIVNIKRYASDLQTCTDMGGDRSATIIWACLSFFLTKFISKGFDSTTTSPNVNRQRKSKSHDNYFHGHVHLWHGG
jgi:hypothetical protein